MKFESHPAADIFPLIEGAEFEALKADIRENGQRNDIVVFDDMILDGRNRYRACCELEIEPDVCELESCDDPIAYVLSLNMHRRHLTESQRAMVAAKVANMRQGERTDKEPSANLRKVSQVQAAQMLGVSARTVTAANRVQKFAVPEVQQAVERGELSVSRAAVIADLDEDEQVEAMQAGFTDEPAPAAADVSIRRRQGIIKGNEAINALKSIGQNDELRIRGYQVVADFIRSNCPEAMAISDMLAEDVERAVALEGATAIPVQLAEDVEFQFRELIDAATEIPPSKRKSMVKRVRVSGLHGFPAPIQIRLNQIIGRCCDAILDAEGLAE